MAQSCTSKQHRFTPPLKLTKSTAQQLSVSATQTECWKMSLSLHISGTTNFAAHMLAAQCCDMLDIPETIPMLVHALHCADELSAI